MKYILLSGGSGKRLWPLSNEIKSKQFIKVFSDGNDEPKSMLQNVYAKIKLVSKESDIVIATSKNQVSLIKNQLGENLNLSIEPSKRDTFPAIVLASVYLKEKLNANNDELISVCPVDHYVEEEFYKTVSSVEKYFDKYASNIFLLGIQPTYPSEKYGYILPENSDTISKVKCFTEKPNEQVAKEYIKHNALWNSGVFVFRLGYLLSIAHSVIDFTNYDDLYEKYDTLNKISFDYQVLEKEVNIFVVKYSGQWKDIGTWNTFCETMKQDYFGNVIASDDCKNTNVINMLDVPILCMGCKDMIISATSNGIIVSDKHQSSYIKPYVDKIVDKNLCLEKSWGEYKVIDFQANSLTIKVVLNCGQKMSYHSHQFRDEVWNILSGNGTIILDGNERRVSCGDIVSIKAGQKHTIQASTKLELIEIQYGKDISKNDKIKYD